MLVYQPCHSEFGRYDIEGRSQSLRMWNDQSAERTRIWWVASPHFGVMGTGKDLGWRQPLHMDAAIGG